MYIALLVLSCIFFLTAACTKSGDCVVKMECPDGLQSTTIIYDINEAECQELAADYEEEGTCPTSYQWLAE